MWVDIVVMAKRYTIRVATDCYYHECTECPRDLPEVVLQLTAKHSDTMVL